MPFDKKEEFKKEFARKYTETQIIYKQKNDQNTVIDVYRVLQVFAQKRMPWMCVHIIHFKWNNYFNYIFNLCVIPDKIIHDKMKKCIVLDVYNVLKVAQKRMS